MSQPWTIEHACAILAGEFSLGRYEAQSKLGAQMLEGMLSKGYAIENPRTQRVALTRVGSQIAKEYTANQGTQR